jgi:hypothetical protein
LLELQHRLLTLNAIFIPVLVFASELLDSVVERALDRLRVVRLHPIVQLLELVPVRLGIERLQERMVLQKRRQELQG